MSFFRRVANLAKGTFSVKVREWGEKEEVEVPEVTVKTTAVAGGPAPTETHVAPEAKPPLERDENGDVKRTL